jgi:hypothetical protein
MQRLTHTFCIDLLSLKFCFRLVFLPKNGISQSDMRIENRRVEQHPGRTQNAHLACYTQTNTHTNIDHRTWKKGQAYLEKYVIDDISNPLRCYQNSWLNSKVLCTAQKNNILFSVENCYAP